MKRTGAQIVCESLIKEGVDVVFGLVGGAILPLYQTLPEYPQLKHIMVRHEQCAAHAAGDLNCSGAVHMRVIPKCTWRMVLGHFDFELKLLFWLYFEQHVIAVSHRGNMQAVCMKICGIEMVWNVVIARHRVGILWE